MNFKINFWPETRAPATLNEF